MLWKLKRKLLSRLSEFLRNCSDAINEYLWRDAEVVFRAVEQLRALDVLARCAKCNALIETTVHCDNCGTFEPTRR